MRYLLPLLLSLLFIGCSEKKESSIEQVLVHDTLYIYNTDTVLVNDNCIELKQQLTQTIQQRDSVQNLLFVANYKIEKAKFYLRVAGSDTQLKFLRGWIKRALE